MILHERKTGLQSVCLYIYIYIYISIFSDFRQYLLCIFYNYIEVGIVIADPYTLHVSDDVAQIM